MSSELAEYKQRLRARLAKLDEIFASVLLGDYSMEVPIPEEDDELAPVFVGVEVMLSSMREQIERYQKLNDRLEKEVEERTRQIQQQNETLARHVKELELFNKAMVGRELKMVELKKEIKAIKTGAEPKEKRA